MQTNTNHDFQKEQQSYNPLVTSSESAFKRNCFLLMSPTVGSSRDRNATLQKSKRTSFGHWKDNGFLETNTSNTGVFQKSDEEFYTSAMSSDEESYSFLGDICRNNMVVAVDMHGSYGRGDNTLSNSRVRGGSVSDCKAENTLCVQDSKFETFRKNIDQNAKFLKFLIDKRNEKKCKVKCDTNSIYGNDAKHDKVDMCAKHRMEVNSQHDTDENDGCETEGQYDSDCKCESNLCIRDSRYDYDATYSKYLMDIEKAKQKGNQKCRQVKCENAAKYKEDKCSKHRMQGKDNQHDTGQNYGCETDGNVSDRKCESNLCIRDSRYDYDATYAKYMMDIEKAKQKSYEKKIRQVKCDSNNAKYGEEDMYGKHRMEGKDSQHDADENDGRCAAEGSNYLSDCEKTYMNNKYGQYCKNIDYDAIYSKWMDIESAKSKSNEMKTVENKNVSDCKRESTSKYDYNAIYSQYLMDIEKAKIKAHEKYCKQEKCEKDRKHGREGICAKHGMEGKYTKHDTEENYGRCGTVENKNVLDCKCVKFRKDKPLENNSNNPHHDAIYLKCQMDRERAKIQRNYSKPFICAKDAKCGTEDLCTNRKDSKHDTKCGTGGNNKVKCDTNNSKCGKDAKCGTDDRIEGKDSKHDTHGNYTRCGTVGNKNVSDCKRESNLCTKDSKYYYAKCLMDIVKAKYTNLKCEQDAKCGKEGKDSKHDVHELYNRCGTRGNKNGSESTLCRKDFQYDYDAKYSKCEMDRKNAKDKSKCVVKNSKCAKNAKCGKEGICAKHRTEEKDSKPDSRCGTGGNKVKCDTNNSKCGTDSKCAKESICAKLRMEAKESKHESRCGTVKCDANNSKCGTDSKCAKEAILSKHRTEEKDNKHDSRCGTGGSKCNSDIKCVNTKRNKDSKYDYDAIYSKCVMDRENAKNKRKEKNCNVKCESKNEIDSRCIKIDNTCMPNRCDEFHFNRYQSLEKLNPRFRGKMDLETAIGFIKINVDKKCLQ